MNYFDNLTLAMIELAKISNSLFIGQSIVAGGTAMTQNFKDIDINKLIEFPVAEDLQLGVAIGLSLSGFIPICIFPRINFMMCCMNQLVLHLDALPLYSDYRPKVIIRTSIASPIPLDPGPQHLDPTSDIHMWEDLDAVSMNGLPYLRPTGYVAALRAMLRIVRVYELTDPARIVPAYLAALSRPTSTILVERADLYDKEDA